MAIITIPSSIGGVTIPGTATKGPLGVLFGGNQKGKDVVQYPRDLGSATKGHAVEFIIKEIRPVGYVEGQKLTMTSIATGAIENAVNAVGGIVETISKSFTAGGVDQRVGTRVGTALGAGMESIKLEPQKTAIKAKIRLYMPETMAFQYNASYNDVSLMDVIVGAATTAAAKIGGEKAHLAHAIQGVNSAIQSDAAKLVLKSQGLALNPMQQLVFQGIDFREFQMAFTFTPHSKQEADSVKKIIELFRTHAAPTINTGGAGMFFVPPSVFDINFLFNGKPNSNVTKVTESVITGIDVNYAPNGWSTHTDGAPVQTTLTVSFRENVLVDRNKIKDGY